MFWQTACWQQREGGVRTSCVVHEGGHRYWSDTLRGNQGNKFYLFKITLILGIATSLALQIMVTYYNGKDAID